MRNGPLNWLPTSLRFCLFLTLGYLNGYAQIVLGEERVFTSTDGQQVRATVELYNPHNRTATLRINGSKHELPLGRFVEKDQAYLVSWRNEYEKSFVRVEFFTLRIEASRIIFMLDSSGSMEGPRWEKMVRNMSEVINEIDEHADFNIILFGSTSKAYNKELVPANHSNKRDAIAWLNSSGPSGGTNLKSAVELAGTMKRADAYAILSDGYPTEAVEIPNTIRDNESKYGNPIRVYTVSYESYDNGIDFLKDLAAKFNGSFARR